MGWRRWHVCRYTTAALRSLPLLPPGIGAEAGGARAGAGEQAGCAPERSGQAQEGGRQVGAEVVAHSQWMGA